MMRTTKYGKYLDFCVIVLIGLADVIDGCSCPSGPNWKAPDPGRCYFSSTLGGGVQMDKFVDARVKCMEMGADLIIVSNPTEMNYLKGSDLRNNGSHSFFWDYWVGAQKLPEDEKPMWLDGTPIQIGFTLKYGSSLENLGAVITTSSGALDMLDKFTRHHYICEKDPCAPIPTTTSTTISSVTTTTVSPTSIVNQDTTSTVGSTSGTSGGNTDSETPQAVPKESNEELPIMWIGVGVGGFVLLVLVIAVIVGVILCKRRKRKATAQDEVSEFGQRSVSSKFTGLDNELFMEEIAYARIEDLPSNKNSNTKGVKNTTINVNIGVAINMAETDDPDPLYARPSQKRRNTEKKQKDRDTTLEGKEREQYEEDGPIYSRPSKKEKSKERENKRFSATENRTSDLIEDDDPLYARPSKQKKKIKIENDEKDNARPKSLEWIENAFHSP